MDGLLGVAGMIITSDYGSFPHSLLSTSKLIKILQWFFGGMGVKTGFSSG
jgi:hypothetical protein